MSWELITETILSSSATTIEANFTNVDFADVAFFVISFQGKDGLASQGSIVRIGTSSGVITSSNYNTQSVYVGDSTHYTNIGYTTESNGSKWRINNSWAHASAFPMLYLWSNPTTNKPQCQMDIGTEKSWTGMSGYLNSTLTSLGEVIIYTESVGTPLNAGDRLQVYKVTR